MFPESFQREIDGIVERYPDARSALLPILHPPIKWAEVIEILPGFTLAA